MAGAPAVHQGLLRPGDVGEQHGEVFRLSILEGEPEEVGDVAHRLDEVVDTEGQHREPHGLILGGNYLE